MNNDLQKRRELRDKVKSLQHELMRVSATNKSLSEECIKRKYIIFLGLKNHLSSCLF